MITTQLYFMPDVEVICGACKGARFNSETLEVTVRGKTIADVLDMSIEEGVRFFAGESSIHRKIQVLDELGLGYLTLGQSATTLSGGEAQRVKIATELSTLQRSKHTLYILDEPTTGLHLADVERLLAALNRLVDAGHTVIVIEHHMDVIKTADHVIDLGPEGGHAGGEIVATGTPEEIVRCKASHTGRFLKHISNLNGSRLVPDPRLSLLPPPYSPHRAGQCHAGTSSGSTAIAVSLNDFVSMIELHSGSCCSASMSGGACETTTTCERCAARVMRRPSAGNRSGCDLFAS